MFTIGALRTTALLEKSNAGNQTNKGVAMPFSVFELASYFATIMLFSESELFFHIQFFYVFPSKNIRPSWLFCF